MDSETRNQSDWQQASGECILALLQCYGTRNNILPGPAQIMHEAPDIIGNNVFDNCHYKCISCSMGPYRLNKLISKTGRERENKNLNDRVWRFKQINSCSYLYGRCYNQTNIYHLHSLALNIKSISAYHWENTLKQASY